MTTEDISARDGTDAAPAESLPDLPVHRLLAELARVEDTLRARTRTALSSTPGPPRSSAGSANGLCAP